MVRSTRPLPARACLLVWEPFAGSLRAEKRAAAIMSLVHSARLNRHDPYAYLRDVLERLPTQPVSRDDELLPHLWQPTRAPS